jgi:hypothetical protein
VSLAVSVDQLVSVSVVGVDLDATFHQTHPLGGTGEVVSVVGVDLDATFHQTLGGTGELVSLSLNHPRFRNSGEHGKAWQLEHLQQEHRY